MAEPAPPAGATRSGNAPRIASRSPGFPTADRPVVTHDLDEVCRALRAARKTGVTPVLLSARGAALTAGPAWFREMLAAARASVPDVDFIAILDCGDAPGAALGAIRAGVPDISLTAPPDVMTRIAAIAKAAGTNVHKRPRGPLQDPETNP